MTTSKRSRVPDVDLIQKEPSLYQFLDAVDKRQQRLGEISDLGGSATTDDIINKINSMLQTQRTK